MRESIEMSSLMWESCADFRGGRSRASASLSRPVAYFLLCCLLCFASFNEVLAATVIEVREGQPVKLNCTLHPPGNANGNFTWTRQDGQSLPTNNNQTSSVLLLPSVNRSSSGVYVCKHSFNSTVSAISRFDLIVIYPAEVTAVLPSPSLTITYGETFQLACIVTAVPALNYTSWTKDGQLLKEVHVPSNLTVAKVQCSDAGEYSCIPNNGLVPLSNSSIKVTIEAAPGDITNLTADNVTSTSIHFSWNLSTNGCLPVTYFLKWAVQANHINENFSDIGSQSRYTITHLKPYTKYVLWIRATNRIGDKYSENCVVTTKVAAPSEPTNVTASNSIVGKIKVSWHEPHTLNGPKNSTQYKIFYQNTSQANSTEWVVINHINVTNHTLDSVDLGVVYWIKIQAFNEGGSSGDSTIVLGKAITPEKEDESDDNSSAALLIGVAVSVSILLVISIIVVVVLIRRKLHCKMPLRGFFNFEEPVDNPAQRITSYTRKEDKREPVPYEAFRSHVSLLHADCDYKFFTEFEAIQGVHEKNKKLTWTHSQKPENHTKNRYANVVSYDHSRVVLSLNEKDPNSHYINANYVDTYKTMNAYIATQGPLAKTIGDFWRMIWEQNCSVIVMITNIIEKGRHKCAQYWPTKNRKSEEHGPLVITFIEEESFAFYTVRTFEVKPIIDGTHYSQDPTDEDVKPMRVKQFHFTGWPDHGAPEPGYEFPVLDLIMKSTSCSEAAGPLVVHCSAGVGRSGAFIVIDSMMKRIHDNGDVDVFNFLAHIRQQRNHLVQEECQYIFIHDTLLEYMSCNFLLSLPIKALKDHVRSLRVSLNSETSSRTKMDLEYEKIALMKIKDYNLKQVKRPCNIKKNRDSSIIPVDSSRVKLYPRPGEDGSDYINASYIDGFWRREAYIATQYPLKNTLFDFWRMIWQENCRTIVMLLSKQEWDKSLYPPYLPVVHDTVRFGDYEVTMESETARGDFMIRDLKMISTKDPSVTRWIRHFHFLHWPEHGQPWSGQTILQLISKVDEWDKTVKSKSNPFEMIGPIVVHCNTGTGRTGIYCTLHTLWHQINREEVVSLYQTAWLHAHQRTKFLPTQAQYESCYDTLIEYIDADCSLYLV